MPYTLVHPGFVLPFKKWKKDWFSNEALIIGSFVPDFDIIFRFTENRFHLYTYTFINTIAVIFPISILSYLFYMSVLKKTVDYIFFNNKNRGRIRPYLLINSKILLSLILSISLHILLDAITHPNVYETTVWINEHLDIPLSATFADTVILYGPLIISSLIGATLLLYFFIKENTHPALVIKNWFTGNKIYYWILFLLVTVMFFLLKLKLNGIEQGFRMDSVLLFSLTGIFYGFILATFLFPFIFKTSALEN